MEQTFRPVLTIRIFGEEKCFGPGVAVLLRKVRELHSLRAAAMSIGMAYSKAWTILKNAQRQAGFRPPGSAEHLLRVFLRLWNRAA